MHTPAIRSWHRYWSRARTAARTRLHPRLLPLSQLDIYLLDLVKHQTTKQTPAIMATLTTASGQLLIA